MGFICWSGLSETSNCNLKSCVESKSLCTKEVVTVGRAGICETKSYVERMGFFQLHNQLRSIGQHPRWSWQDLVLAGLGFWDSEMAGEAAFLVGSTPMGKKQSSCIFVIPLVSTIRWCFSFLGLR